ncbi:MAG TPA: 1-deoxy-D-xylulose-5-phosphate reductoisomerase [Edaphocola sp.]|nr:1-deoxy-D-xylulose-5-phosphate reductoisomerase [Edaphocola sp.]
MTKKRIAILGATNSIGIHALEVIDKHPDLFEVEVLVADSNIKLLLSQVEKYKPNAVVVMHQQDYDKVNQEFKGSFTKIFLGEDALLDVVQWDSVDFVLATLDGFTGLNATLAAINAKKQIGLVNDSLVIAGKLLMEQAHANNVQIIPADSEHSAIFQCMVGEDFKKIEKILITASGGPFLGKKPNFLVNVKKSHAIQNPNWVMDEKYAINSATMMNKGLEVIKAKWLFDLKPDQLEVVVHPQSIIHSMVQFTDGSIKAQLGPPDIKFPIHFALNYPNRVSNDYQRFDFKSLSKFTFEQPDTKTFQSLQLGYEALQKNGNMPCILNAANEVAVAAFLDNKIGFLQISEIVENAMSKITFIEQPSFEDLRQTNEATINFAQEEIKNIDY